MTEDGAVAAGQELAPDMAQEHAGQAPAGREAAGQEPERFDPEYVKKLRAESANARARVRELETAHKAAEDAKLSEHERLTKRVAELEARDTEQSRQLQERVLRYEIQLQAARLNIVDPDAALKLLDLSSIEYDPDGQPLEVEKALRALLKDKPYLVAATAGAGGGQQQGASPTNAATRAANGAGQRRYSQADLADRDTYTSNREDIIRAYREGRIDS